MVRAVNDRNSEFRTPVFICGNNNDLDGRVIVLRKADQKNNIIQYHSDIRSSKIDKIKKIPNAQFSFMEKKKRSNYELKPIVKLITIMTSLKSLGKKPVT